MTYSCAYFCPPEISLEEAQRRKRQVIYRKLLLSDGDSGYRLWLGIAYP